MPTDLTVRSGDERDFPFAAGIRALVNQDRIISAEGMAVMMGGLPERAALATWVAAADGRPVGWAMAMRAWTQADDGVANVDVVVHPDHQGVGVGRALVDPVEARLRTLGAHTTRASSLDVPASRHLAESLGFRETHATSTSAVDPRTIAPADLPTGVRLVPFGDLADPRPVYELDLDVSRDVPGDESFESMTLDEWTARFWHSVFADDECSLVAFVGDEPAGLTMLRVDRESNRAQNNITGVRREHRRRGLARLLKTHSLHLAAQRGVTQAVTDNDETNAPMLGLNRALGYTHLARRVEWERRTDPA